MHSLEAGPARSLPGFRDQSVSTAAFSQRVACSRSRPLLRTRFISGSQKWIVKCLLQCHIFVCLFGFVFNKAFGLSTLRLSGQGPPCPVSASNPLRVSSWTPAAAGPCSLQPVSRAGSQSACTCCSCWGSVSLKNRRAGTCMHEQPLLRALLPQKQKRAEGRGAGIILGWSRLLPL